MLKLHWPPSKFLSLNVFERSFVCAAIDVYTEDDQKAAADLKAKARR